MFARKISKKVNKKNRERYFIAGLLHDVGKLLLEPFVEKHFQEIQECVSKGNLSIAEAERRVLGFDHAFIGARLAEKWNLPEVFVEMIEFHHDPSVAHKDRITDIAIIYTANILSYRLQKGVGKSLQHEHDILNDINRFIPLNEAEITIMQKRC